MLRFIWWRAVWLLLAPVFYVEDQARRSDFILLPLIIVLVVGMFWALHAIVHALNAFPNTIR